MNPFRRALAWLDRDVLAVDTLLAVVLMFLSVPFAASTTVGFSAGLLFNASNADLVWWTLPTAVPLAMRRWRPRMAAWLYVAVTIPHLFLGPLITFGDICSLIMLYSVLAYGERRGSGRFVVVALAMVTLTSFIWSVAINLGPMFPEGRDFALWRTSWLPTGSTMPVCPAMQATAAVPYAATCGEKIVRDAVTMLPFMALTVLSVAVMGYWKRSRLATTRAMRERNAAIEARQDEDRRIAALAERARIARDMHDVVAHTLSTIIIQSDGGRYAGTHDLALARDTMHTIRREAVRAKQDMRRLFGTVGTTYEVDPATGPVDAFHAGAGRANSANANAAAVAIGMPSAANASEPTGAQPSDDRIGYHAISALLDGAGIPVTRRIDGQARPDLLSPAAGTAVYRLVQEALSNARRHAGPGAKVTIDERWTGDGLSITVSDDGRGAKSTVDGHQPGYGLIGMRERVTAVGGTLEAGPGSSGVFRVAAALPFAPGAATSTVKLDQSGDGRMDDPTTAPAASAHRSMAEFIDRLRSMLRVLRSRTFAQGDDADANWIELTSRWTERHYVLVDMLEAAFVAVMFFPSTLNGMAVSGDPLIYMPGWGVVPAAIITAVILLPLAFRRRFPEASALAMAVAAALQLMVLPSVLGLNVFALVSVYSAVLYGRPQVRRWVIVALAVDSALFGAKVMAGWNGYDTLLAFMAGYGGDGTRRMAILLSAAFPGGMVFVMGMGCVASALWARSRGSNALVLRQREEALRAEQERVKVLSANFERERIGAAIQAEVSATLDTVVMQADAGLALFEGRGHGQTDADSPAPSPSPEAIAAAFEAIGRRGREALAHMRQLLGVLRESGFSDEAHAGAQASPRLAPAESLEQQLARAQG